MGNWGRRSLVKWNKAAYRGEIYRDFRIERVGSVFTAENDKYISKRFPTAREARDTVDALLDNGDTKGWIHPVINVWVDKLLEEKSDETKIIVLSIKENNMSGDFINSLATQWLRFNEGNGRFSRKQAFFLAKHGVAYGKMK